MVGSEATKSVSVGVASGPIISVSLGVDGTEAEAAKLAESPDRANCASGKKVVRGEDLVAGRHLISMV